MKSKHRDGRRLWMVTGLVAVLVLGAALFLLKWSATDNRADAGPGTPHVAFDRTEIDLGDMPFNKPATATFTVSNVGDGVLKIVDLPPAKALQGC